MPLQLGDHRAVLEGTVTVEDVEELTAWLRRTTGPHVDLHACGHLHTAVLQALLSAGVKVDVPPSDPFLRDFVMPVLRGATTDGPPAPGESAPTAQTREGTQ